MGWRGAQKQRYHRAQWDCFSFGLINLAGSVNRYRYSALAIESSFNLLGQAAGREMFSDPPVGANISEMEKYFDSKKLQQLGDLK